MVYLEKLPLLTARPILEFIQSSAAKKCTGWISARCLEIFFGDPKMSTQLENMKRINEELEKIKQDTPNKVKAEWEHLNTRLFQAEMGISHKFRLMQTILSTENCKERFNEVSRLRAGILDTNSGILSNLSVIHQGLMGHTMGNPTDQGLLEMWYKGVYNNMIEQPISAKTLHEYVMKYLSWAVILQFKGFILFAGASDNSGFCLHQFTLFEKNLECQIQKMEKIVPKYMKYLTDPHEKNVFVMRPILGGDCDPFVKRRGPGKKLKNDFFGGYTEDGKWHFEKSETFVKDGSLLISGKSSIKKGEKYYIQVPNSSKAECVSERRSATPFYVIPLDFENKTMKITICKSGSQTGRFLGDRLTFINEKKDSKFNLTFDCV
ncbi:Hypothetical predicted protein [Mytilus galloprovincialis]|uniref:Uncharacterized protein n=1 Tax=Mytilus galloprovincialis TaxID=29158 RepID=A0A8B6C002_MYTGA|nr:Hypothetical predicted protein [Mytilus galloprovincialis]